MPDLPKISEILYSGSLTYGEYTKQFEEKLRKYFNTPYVIVTNSFNTAISVAVTTLGLSFGDEVIASPLACLASTQPYLSSGLRIRWCDVDNKRGTLDPEDLEKKITKSTKAIIHNHFCGYPGYIDEINYIGRKHGIPVIDDGIECFGSEYKDKKIGNCGTDVTVFSFTAVRMPNTIDGGAVIFKSKDLFEKSLRIRDCGIDRAFFRDSLGEINPKCDISEVGYSATMSNVNGYIGSMQMETVDNLIFMQRKNANKIDKWIKCDARFASISCHDCSPNYWVYGLLTSDKRETIEYFRKNSIYASGIHIKNNIYSVFQDNKALAGVDDFFSHYVAIPSGWWLDDDLYTEKL